MITPAGRGWGSKKKQVTTDQDERTTRRMSWRHDPGPASEADLRQKQAPSGDFGIETCEKCRGTVKIIDWAGASAVIRQILEHLIKSKPTIPTLNYHPSGHRRRSG